MWGKAALTNEGLQRLYYFWLFQLPQAEGFVEAGDFAFIDHLWSYWSPGYDAAEDLARAKDCLRPPGHLSATIGYYRTIADPTRFLEAEWAAEHAEVWGAIPEHPTLYLHGSRDGVVALDDALLAEIGGAALERLRGGLRRGCGALPAGGEAGGGERPHPPLPGHPRLTANRAAGAGERCGRGTAKTGSDGGGVVPGGVVAAAPRPLTAPCLSAWRTAPVLPNTSATVRSLRPADHEHATTGWETPRRGGSPVGAG